MAPNSAVLALALLTTSSLALPFNFPFWSHPDQGSWHANHHPHGPSQGRPHSGPPNGNPGGDHPFHYSVVGPWGYLTESTSLVASSEAISRPHHTGTDFGRPTEPAPTFPTATGLPYSYPTSSSFQTPTSYPLATGAILPTGTGFPYPTGTGFSYATGIGFPFPTATVSPNPPSVPYGPPYGVFQPPGDVQNCKRFQGPRRQRGGPQQQQWQPYHGPWGEGEQHGYPHSPPHEFKLPTPTAYGAASTGFVVLPTGVFPTGVVPTGGYATRGIPLPTGYAWPTARPEWEGEGGHGPLGWGGHGGHGGYGLDGRE